MLFSSRFRSLLRNYMSLRGALFIGVALVLIMSFLAHSDSMFVSKAQMPMSVDPVQMANGIEYRQQIPYQKGELRAFQIRFGTNARINRGTLKVSLLHGSTELQSWNINTSHLPDCAYRKFDMAAPFEMDPSASYFIVLSDTYAGANNIAFFTSDDANRIEYAGRVMAGKSFSVFFEVSDNAQKAFYKKIIAAFLLVTALATGLLVNPRDIKVSSYIFLLVCGLLCFRMLDYNLFQNLAKTVYITDPQKSQKYDTIKPQESKKYSAYLSYMHFDTLKIYLEGDNRENIHVRLTDDEGTSYADRDIRKWDIAGDGRAEKTAVSISFPEQLPPGQYNVEIKNTGTEPLRLSVRDKGELNFSTSVSTFLSGKIALCIIGILFLYVIVIFTVSSHSDLSVEKWFLLTVTPLAIVYMILFTPWSQPDTTAHMYATYRLSNKLLGYHERDVWKGREEDAEFLRYVWGHDPNPSLKSYAGIAENAHLVCGKTDIVNLPGAEPRMKFYSAFNYLPQVIGITLGRLLHLSTVASVYLGRMLILLLYIMTMYRNISKIPAGKWIFATIVMFPMALMMSSAVSYDAMVIISSLSFIACIFRLRKERSRSVYIETAIWCFIAGAVKGGGYVLMLLPLSFMIFDRSHVKRSIHQIIGLIEIGAFSVLLFDRLIPSSLGFQFGTDGNSRLTAGYALHEPLHYLDMALNSYSTYFDLLTINTAGSHLAWLEWTLPLAAVSMFMLIGGVQAIFEKDDMELRKSYKWIGIAVIFIGLISIPAMLLSWTEAGSRRVEGMQGRYFLPLVPVFYFLITKYSLHVSAPGNYGWILKRGIIWMTALSSVFVYYLMTIYLTR